MATAEPLRTHVSIPALEETPSAIIQSPDDLNRERQSLQVAIRIAEATSRPKEEVLSLKIKLRVINAEYKVAHAIESGQPEDKIKLLKLKLQQEKINQQLRDVETQNRPEIETIAIKISEVKIKIEIAKLENQEEVQHLNVWLENLQKTYELLLRFPHLDSQKITEITNGLKTDPETAVHFYNEEIPVMKQKLLLMGLDIAAEDISNLSAKYSRLDGSPLTTIIERKIFYEKMLNLSKIDLEFYQSRPKTDFPGTDWGEQNTEKRKYNDLKEYTAKFVDQKVIPDFIKKKMPFKRVILELHKWHMRGSIAQLFYIQEENENITAQFRKETVSVSGYMPPSKDRIPELITAYTEQIESYSRQLEAEKETLTMEQYIAEVIKLAVYAQQRFVDIHPMKDGNGRTSRSLYTYVVTKHLGEESPYCSFPMGSRPDGEPTMHKELRDYNMKSQIGDFSSTRTRNPEANADILMRILTQQAFEEMSKNAFICEYGRNVQLILTP